MLANISGGSKSDDLDAIAEFISFPKDEYGQGMENVAISYLNREKAIKGKCSFFDPHTVNGNVAILNRELIGQNKKNLLTGPINVYGNEHLAPNNSFRDLFLNTLKALNNQGCNKDFDKIIIPIGCQEQGVVGHNICVFLENVGTSNPQATILDQMGQGYYNKTKEKIGNDLIDIGIYDVKWNKMPLSPNRNDCATVVSLLSEFALDGENMRQFSQNSDQHYINYNKTSIPTSLVDDTHSNDQDLLINASARLANDMIKETYSVNDVSVLRGLSNVPEANDIVLSRINKYKSSRNTSQMPNNGNVKGY